MVDVLSELGADVNTENEDGNSLLTLDVINNKVKMAKFLIDKEDSFSK